jgi:hypothetical protein
MRVVVCVVGPCLLAVVSCTVPYMRVFVLCFVFQNTSKKHSRARSSTKGGLGLLIIKRVRSRKRGKAEKARKGRWKVIRCECERSKKVLMQLPIYLTTRTAQLQAPLRLFPSCLNLLDFLICPLTCTCNCTLRYPSAFYLMCLPTLKSEGKLVLNEGIKE